jgi:hypothetical protein
LALEWNQDQSALDQRAEWLRVGEQMLYAKRVERFAFANAASKDRETLHDLLYVWLTFWRDLVIRTSNSSAPISNPDVNEELTTLAGRLTFQNAWVVLRAIDHSLEQLSMNVNAKLAIEGLLLQFPVL